ncbi:MAG: NAD-dependent epimerase/dehydratase family protein [Pseudorhodoplanes sp.]
MSSSDAPELVTGASGFVGRHLVEALLRRGTKVIALCRPTSLLPEHWRNAVERIDCRDWSTEGIAAALSGRAFVSLYHLAAYGVVPTDRDAGEMRRINAQLPAALVRLCGQSGAAMVMAGSSAEYRRPDGHTPLTEDAPLEADKAYGASKARGTLDACRIADEAGVPLRVLRLFNVYGPGEAGHRLLPSLLSGLAANQRISLSEGRQVRDFVYVGDVVEALLAAADHARSEGRTTSRVWNVATEKGHSVREFAEMTARLLGGGADLLGFGDLPMRPDEIEWLVGSAQRIRETTGWSPRHDLASGIAASLSRMSDTQAKARASR